MGALAHTALKKKKNNVKERFCNMRKKEKEKCGGFKSMYKKTNVKCHN